MAAPRPASPIGEAAPEVRIKIATDLLEAMARCCSQGDATRWTSYVIFDKHELVACSGHMLVRVAIHDLTPARFCIEHSHIEAAIAAQDMLFRTVSDVVDLYSGEVRERIRASRDRGGHREIAIVRDGLKAEIAIGASLSMQLPALNPDIPDLDLVSRTTAEGDPPAGIMIDPRYLSRIQDVARIASGINGVHLIGWGNDRAHLSPLKFRAGPMTAVLMPMRSE